MQLLLRKFNDRLPLTLQGIPTTAPLVPIPPVLVGRGAGGCPLPNLGQGVGSEESPT